MDNINIFLPKSKNYFIITHLFFIIIYSSNIKNILIKTLKNSDTHNKFLTIIKKILKNDKSLEQLFAKFNADFLFIQMIKSCKLSWLSNILKTNSGNNSINNFYYYNHAEYIVKFFECLNFNFTDIIPISDNLIYFNLYKVIDYRLNDNLKIVIKQQDLVKSQPSNIPDIIIYRKKIHNSNSSLEQFSHNLRNFLTFNDENRKITYLSHNYVLNSFILSCDSTDKLDYALISGIKINDRYFIMASNSETYSIIEYDWSLLTPFILRYNKRKNHFKISHNIEENTQTQYYYKLNLDYALLFYTKDEMSFENLELSNYSSLKSQDFSFDLLKDIYDIDIDTLNRQDIIHNIRKIDKSKLTLDFATLSDEKLKKMFSEIIYNKYNIKKSLENSSDSASFHSAEQSFSNEKIEKSTNMPNIKSERTIKFDKPIERLNTKSEVKREVKIIKGNRSRRNLTIKDLDKKEKSKRTIKFDKPIERLNTKPEVKREVKIIKGNRSRRNLTIKDLDKREKSKRTIKFDKSIERLNTKPEVKREVKIIKGNRSRRNLTIKDLDKREKSKRTIKFDKPIERLNTKPEVKREVKIIKGNRSRRNLTITKKLNKTTERFKEELDKLKKPTNISINIMQPKKSINRSRRNLTITKKSNENLKKELKKELNKTTERFKEELDKLKKPTNISINIMQPKKSINRSRRNLTITKKSNENLKKELNKTINLFNQKLDNAKHLFQRQLNKTITTIRTKPKSNKYLKKEINNLKELFKEKINKTKNIFQEELHKTRELITEKLPIFEDIKKPKYKSRYQTVRFADYSDEIDDNDKKEELQSIYSNLIKKELAKTREHFQEELKDTIDLLKREIKSIKDDRTIKYRKENDIKHLSLPTRRTEFDFAKTKSINKSNDLISENLKKQITRRYRTNY